MSKNYTMTTASLVLTTVDKYMFATVALKMDEDGNVLLYNGKDWVAIDVDVRTAELGS